MTKQDICFIGAGFVGGPSGAVLALKNPHINVHVVDLDQARIAAWQSDDLPLYEPGLLDVVKQARAGVERPQNLFFSTNVRHAINICSLIFICVNTPTKITGAGAGRASNLAFLESATRMIAEEACEDKIVVEKSTVPCRTAATIREIMIKTAKPGLNFPILSNPEFLAEGTAIRDLLEPDRILIGSLSNDTAAAMRLIDIYNSWVPRGRILTMNLWSSELAKLAANALLAQRISSTNSLSAICESTGADVNEIARAVGLDSRIGPKMLQASVGFGGSCFRKDVLNLAYMAESLHYPEVAAYWQSVVSINEWQKHRFSRTIIRGLFNNVFRKNIAVFGFAYKKNTSDARESPAITIIKDLLDELANVSIYDPQVPEKSIRHELGSSLDGLEASNLRVCQSPYEAVQDAHAVVVLTEWEEFADGIDNGVEFSYPSYKALRQTDMGVLSPALTENSSDEDLSSAGNTHYTSLGFPKGSAHDSEVHNMTDYEKRQARHDSMDVGKVDWQRVAGLMARPAHVFDGRRIVNAAKLQSIGFQVHRLGSAF